MAGSCYIISNDRYTYKHNDDVIDSHHILNNNNNYNYQSLKCFLFYFSLPAISLFLLKGESIYIPLWSLIISALLVRNFMQKNVEKESIIIIRGFGVQLETLYRSGRKVHRFFPIDKILKPVLNECVTPVTCYWSLSLIVRGEEELVLVFKGMRPPLKMLIPIWKALCAATSCPQNLEAFK